MDAIEEMRPVSLDEVDRRAALLRRVDTKFVLKRDAAERLFRRLAADHDVLTIDGRRRFGYESVYFDTPDLASFRDHVAGRTPRTKVRSRLYADTDVCSLELKIKRDDGETDKRHLDYDTADHGLLTPEACAFLDRELRDRTGRALPDDLEQSLTTAFRRATLAAEEDAERATVDVDLRMARRDGRTARLPDELVLVETKTGDGDGRCGRLLRDAGIEEISLSKYRTGIALLATSPDDATEAGRHFQVEPTR
jgi:hypothetical protein